MLLSRFISKGGLVPFNGVIDDLISLLPSFELEYFHFLVLKFLVVLEEAMHLIKDMLGQFLNIIVMLHRHVILGN